MPMRSPRPDHRPSRCVDPADPPTAAQINLRLAPASLEERAVIVDELKADLDARIAALDRSTPTASCSIDLPDGPGRGHGDAGRSRHRRHRSAREPVVEPCRTDLSGAVPGRAVPGAAVPQLQPGDAGARAGVPGGRRVVADRRAARYPAQPADHGVGSAGDRHVYRVLGADLRPIPRRTRERARTPARPATPPPPAPVERSSPRRSPRSAVSPC